MIARLSRLLQLYDTPTPPFHASFFAIHALCICHGPLTFMLALVFQDSNKAFLQPTVLHRHGVIPFGATIPVV